MKMLKSRSGVVFVPLMIVIIVIVLLIILMQIGEICIFGKCFYLISPQFQSELTFWILFISWIAIQVLFVYCYIKLGFLTSKAFRFGRQRWDRFLNYVRKIFS